MIKQSSFKMIYVIYVNPANVNQEMLMRSLENTLVSSRKVGLLIRKTWIK